MYTKNKKTLQLYFFWNVPFFNRKVFISKQTKTKKQQKKMVKFSKDAAIFATGLAYNMWIAEVQSHIQEGTVTAEELHQLGTWTQLEMMSRKKYALKKRLEQRNDPDFTIKNIPIPEKTDESQQEFYAVLYQLNWNSLPFGITGILQQLSKIPESDWSNINTSLHNSTEAKIQQHTFLKPTTPKRIKKNK